MSSRRLPFSPFALPTLNSLGLIILVPTIVALCVLAPGARSVVAAASAAEPPLRIGVGAPLHGPDAIFGNQLRVGIEQAVADINASGGFLGRRGRVVPGDDGSDPKQGAAVAKGFVKAKIKLVVGHFSSAVTMPASAIYAEAGVLDITPSATGPLITDRGLATIFRTCGREDQQAGVAAAFLLGRHYAKIAIVHDRTARGKALADGVRDALAAGGVRAAAIESFAEGTRDLSGVVKRIRDAGSQIVFWGGDAAGAGLLARQLQNPDAPIPLLGGLATASDEFAGAAGPAAEGSFTIFPRDPLQHPAAADLLRRLKAKKIDPGAYVFYAYAAVQVMRQAAVDAHALEPRGLAAQIHSGTTFQTVLGPMAFDDKGDPKITDLMVYVWHKGATGKMNFLEPAGS